MPEAWRNRYRLTWGQTPLSTRSGSRAARRASPGEKWLAFAGGFYTKAPACVPLIVGSGPRSGG